MYLKLCLEWGADQVGLGLKIDPVWTKIKMKTIHSQGPYPLELKFAPIVTLVQCHVSTKLGVSMAFQFRENWGHGTNRYDRIPDLMCPLPGKAT